MSFNLGFVLFNKVSNSLLKFDNLCDIIFDHSISLVNFLYGFDYFWFFLNNYFLINDFLRLRDSYCLWEFLDIDKLNRFRSLWLISKFNFLDFIIWINSHYCILFLLYWSSNSPYFLNFEWYNLNNFSYGCPHCWNNLFNLLNVVRSYYFESLFSCHLF